MNRELRNRADLDKSQLAAWTKNERWSVSMRAIFIMLIYISSVVLVLIPGFEYTALFIWPFVGFIFSGFLQAAHDCIHQTHMPSKKGNRIMGAVWCTPILANFTIYRYQHLEHHRHTGVDGDTESHTTYASVRAYLYVLTGIFLWRHSISTIIRTWKGGFPPSITTDQQKADARLDNLVVCCWTVVAIALTVVFPRALLFAYWIPLFFYASAAMLVSLPEHYELSGIRDVVRNTRSIRTNSIVRYFLWNANYHAEHHAFPGIATLNLHRLHKATMKLYNNRERSYLSFHFKLFKSLFSRNGRDWIESGARES